VDDLAIREAVRRNYGFDERPTPKQLRDFADPWKPYRTVASWYLWRSPKLHTPLPKPEVPKKAKKAVR
jgi:3-methyladenine DNA glycosylase/8-oxoguanine DNA glycosylase